MIVVIDNYDSFTYNLVDYIGRASSSEVAVFRNDAVSVEQLKALSPTHIVISPGPKTPSEAGISKGVVESFYRHLPILGVCLGHQAICEVFGWETVLAKHLMHGKTSMIQREESPIFKGIPNPFCATRYHSLSVNIVHKTPEFLNIIATSQDDREIMAVSHTQYPTYGLQFHPESILTKNGPQMIANFLSL